MSYILAYDYPERRYKEIFKELKKLVDFEFMPVDWPHTTITRFKEKPTKEQIAYMIELSKRYKPTFHAVGFGVFKGVVAPKAWLVLKFEKSDKYNKLQDEIEAYIGKENVDNFGYLPHCSIFWTDPKNFDKLQDLLPKIQEEMKAFFVSNVPEKTFVWDDTFNISYVSEAQKSGALLKRVLAKFSR